MRSGAHKRVEIGAVESVERPSVGQGSHRLGQQNLRCCL